ncbi:hypothetical protein GCM10023091_00060 [Ravibacter arvi]|uniref:Secretion system C-terminal sorting domain-containing protein n=1 Tax=Ravibacter arvi TaxID=2051041 RepID=A0ABP8LJR4_9BACT
MSVDGEQMCTPPELVVEIKRYTPLEQHDGYYLTLVSKLNGTDDTKASFTWLPGGKTGESIEVHVDKPTIYTATALLTGSCEGLLEISQTIQVPPPTPGLMADAGKDNLEYCGTRLRLQANNPPLGCSGYWFGSRSEVQAFSDDRAPDSFFTGAPGESYSLLWYLTDGYYSSKDEVMISFNKYKADAGPDQVGTTCGPIVLTGNVNEFGVKTKWRIINGLGGNLENDSDFQTKFIGFNNNTYIIRFTVFADFCVTEDDITVQYKEKPSIASAGPDQLKADKCDLPIIGLAADQPLIGFGEWSIVSGSGGSFTDRSNPASVFKGAPGTAYVLKWSTTNPPCEASHDEATVSIGNIPALSVNADAQQAFVGDNIDYNLITPECRIIATVNGVDLTDGINPFYGRVTIDNSVLNYAGQPCLQRHFQFTTGNSAATADVILYVNKSEMMAFNASSTKKLPVDPSDDKSNLRVWQWHEASATGPPDKTIDPDDNDIEWDEMLGAWKIKFPVSGFSSFYLTAENAAPLPVTLVSFSAGQNEKGVTLFWQTTEEINSDHFEIQRSSDARNWTGIGKIQAKGESRGVTTYSFIDSNPAPGFAPTYYRLKITDRDATFIYSRIISISVENNPTITVFPNPASHMATIRSAEPISGYELFSGNGMMIKGMGMRTARNTEINLSFVPAGLYLLRLKFENGETVYRKLVVE